MQQVIQKHLKPGTPRDHRFPCQESYRTIWQMDLCHHIGTVPGTQEYNDRGVIIGAQLSEVKQKNISNIHQKVINLFHL